MDGSHGTRWQSTEDVRETAAGRRILPACGDDEQAPTLAQPASQESDQVKGCLIGPVRILDDEERRFVFGDDGQQRVEYRIATDCKALFQSAADITRDITDWAQRSGRGQRVTQAAQHANATLPSTECIDECSLTQAGVAYDRNDRTATLGRKFERVAENAQRSLALEQRSA